MVGDDNNIDNLKRYIMSLTNQNEDDLLVFGVDYGDVSVLTIFI